MKPCCIPTDERCVDIANPWDEWECEAAGGILGPEGACCHIAGEGVCADPDQRCWRCPWHVADPDDTATCCFSPGLDIRYQFFDEIAVEQCERCAGHQGGTHEECGPSGPSLFRPCCTVEQDCFNVPLNSQQEEICERDGGALGPPGTCCFNPDEASPPCYDNRCWICDWPVGFQGSCCFPNYFWLGSIPPEQCGMCGGEVGEENTGEAECGPDIPEPECIDAPREDRLNPAIHDDEGTHLQWTLDTIGTVVFGLSGTEDVLPGYQYQVSTHLIRPKQSDTPLDSCGHASGRMTMLDDGYVYLETCSKPDRTSEDSFRRSYGLLRTFLPEDNSPLAEKNRLLGLEDGYQYDVACIRLPSWTEATYRSQTARCGTDPA